MRIIREILEAIKIFSEPSDEDLHTAYEKEKSKKRARKLMHESTILSLKETQMSLRIDAPIQKNNE